MTSTETWRDCNACHGEHAAAPNGYCVACGHENGRANAKAAR